MNEVRTSVKLGGPLNWQWIWVGFCLLVTFHMIPTALIIHFLDTWKPLRIVLPLWIFSGLALTGIYIGYRSLGVTIIEPLISSLAYMVMLGLMMNAQFEVMNHRSDLLIMVIWMIPGLIYSIIGAWIGELSQLKKEQKEAKASS